MMSVSSRTFWEGSVLIDQNTRFVVSGNGLVVTTNSGGKNFWLEGVASNCVYSGKAYYEVKCNFQDGGMCLLGWSRTVEESNRGVFRNHGRKFDDGDVIGCYIDVERRIVSFTVNGVSQGIAFSEAPPVEKKLLYPTYWLKNASAEFNFGASPFAYAPTDINFNGQLKGSRFNYSRLRFSSNQLLAINHSDEWCGGIASHMVSKGKFFYEVKCIAAADGGSFRLGWSQLAGMYDNSPLPLDMFYGSTGIRSSNSDDSRYGVRFGIDDVIGCYLDCDLKTVSYTVNGVFQGVAFTHKPTYTYTIKFESLYPAYWLKNASAEFNFGASPFIYSPGDFHDSPVWTFGNDLPRLNERFEDANTELHLAVYHIEYELVIDLINCGSDVELKNKYGRTPLHTAANRMCASSAEHFGLAQLLVELGRSNIFARCPKGLTPIDMIISDHLESAKSLIISSRWPRRRHFIPFLYSCKLFLVSDSRDRRTLGMGALLRRKQLGLDWHFTDMISPRWDSSADVQAPFYCEITKNEVTSPILPVDEVTSIREEFASVSVDTSAFKRVIQQNPLIGCIASFL